MSRLIWSGSCTRANVRSMAGFNAEVISKPPREIFPVVRPFGVARGLVVDGEEVYAFATVWNDLTPAEKRQKVDPFDRRYWKVRGQTSRANG